MSLRNSLRVRGVSGTLQLMWLRCFNSEGTPEYLLSRRLDLQKFDREHNVETAGMIETDDLHVESPSKAHGTRYGAITPWRMKDLLDSIPEDFREYTFIDIGSGKGAALFHASDYPFKEIIGVEYAPELHSVAVRNIAEYRSRTRLCERITSVCGDGGTYVYPEGPWVLFYNTPFGLPIWKLAAERLAEAERGKGQSYLIFTNFGWNAGAGDFVNQLSFLKLIHEDDTSRLYEFVG